MKKSDDEETCEIVDDKNLIACMFILLFLFEIFWLMNRATNTC